MEWCLIQENLWGEFLIIIISLLCYKEDISCKEVLILLEIPVSLLWQISAFL